MNIKQLENSGVQAVRMLRKSKLNNGDSFMINTNDLPSTQCYMEYPDGLIKIVTIGKDKMDFTVISELTLQQSNNIRKKYKIG